MRIKSILVSMLAVAALASCTKEKGGGNNTPANPDLDAAYMSISVMTPTSNGTRAGSTEDPSGPVGEGKIDAIYAITFAADKTLIHHSKENPVIELTGTDKSQPNAIRISANSKYVLLIANPGTKLKSALNAAASGDTYAKINKAIQLSIGKSDKRDILVNEIRTISDKGGAAEAVSKFTMINSGDIDEDALIEIDNDKMQYVGDTSKGPNYHATEAEAAEAANTTAANRQTIGIERLTSKMKVIVPANADDITKPANSYFVFKHWTLDALNSTFFPYADKKEILGSHTKPNGGFYDDNFYTVDPNFEDATGTPVNEANIGIMYNKLSVADKYAPYVTWLAAGKVDYSLENTMADAEQRYMNATRIVIEATYYPADVTRNGTNDNDWFRFAGKNYTTIEEVIEDYEDAVDLEYFDALQDACEEFYTRVKALSTAITATKFEELTTTMLVNARTDIPHGAEIIKDDGCLRWYQKGRNYYYYEIRHDNTNDATMAFGKYGVVRNNFYNLTLTKVGGHGTPWYPAVKPDPDPTDPEYPDPKPEPEEPGPDPKPDPEDPIDEETGFISFDVKVAPWISWSTNFEI